MYYNTHYLVTKIRNIVRFLKISGETRTKKVSGTFRPNREKRPENGFPD